MSEGMGMIDLFDIPMPMPTLPTAEQMNPIAERWMDQLRHCLYTHWPEEFKRLSFATHVELMTEGETQELVDNIDNPKHKWSWDLRVKFDRGARKFDSGTFFRLESRSPKDNYWGEITAFRACSAHDVFKLLYSERVVDDLVMYRYLKSEPLRILFREWHPIQKAGEFRCFIRNRKLAGGSQYHQGSNDNAGQYSFRACLSRKGNWKDTLNTWFDQEILPYLHADNLVVDLSADCTSGNITLIEINPYGLSDPCLLTYEELETTNDQLFRF
jgi:hypothetical protein